MDARLTMDLSGHARPGVPMGLEHLITQEKILPFTVRAVTSDEQLGKAVSIRHRAYGRHVPALAEQLRAPEPLDRASGCVVLLAESKLDGDPVGTMRIQTNAYRPLALEASATLPRRFAGRSLAEATRLGVSLGQMGHAVRTALFKAFYLYCLQAGVEWMVITARAPLERIYDALLFEDVFPGEAPRPMKHVGNIPHRVLSFEVGSAEERWREARHPLYEFVFQTAHRDIDLAIAEPFFTAAPQVDEAQAALAA